MATEDAVDNIMRAPMPTLPVLEMLEAALGKPVISSATAMMWRALRLARVGQPLAGHGRLLTLS